MALTSTEWTVATNGDIRVASPVPAGRHPVIDLHRWLMDLLDNSAAGSPLSGDFLDVTAAIIPSTRSTDQIITLNAPYNIGDTEAEYFFGGSITQDGGDTQYSGLQVVGSVPNVSPATQLMIVQNNVNLTNYWGDGTGFGKDAANNILLEIVVKSRTGGADTDGKRIRVQARELGDTYAEFGVTLGQGESVAAIFTGVDDFNGTAAATIEGWDTIVNTPEGYQGLDVDNNTVNEFYYSNWDTGSQSRNDLYERAKWLSQRGSASGSPTNTIYSLAGQLFRGITHEINVDTNVGTFEQNATVSWTEATVASTGLLIATDSFTAATKFWIQLLTGIAPTDGTVITQVGSPGATVEVAPTGVVQRTVNANCFLGNFTGSLTGAYGVGAVPGDLVNTDSLRALDNIARNPPNNVTVVVTGLSSGDVVFSAKTKTHTTTAEGVHSLGDLTLTLGQTVPADYDSIGRAIVDGDEIIFTSFAAASPPTITVHAPGLPAALSGGEAVTVTQFYNDEFTTDSEDSPGGSPGFNSAGDAVVQMTTSIGTGFPTTGEVRLFNGTTYDKYSYTSIVGTQLLGISPVLSQAYDGVAAFIPYIDEVAGGSQISKTVVYSSDVSGRHRVYNASANIVPFEVGFTITSAGTSTQAIRGSDA